MTWICAPATATHSAAVGTSDILYYELTEEATVKLIILIMRRPDQFMDGILKV